MAMERTMERTRDYFSKFLKPSVQPVVAPAQDRVGEFHRSWMAIKGTLEQPDERQLRRGIKSTDVPVRLQTLVDLLVSESTRAEEGATGQCLEYLLKNDVLGTLVKLSETDRPFGIQAEVLRSVQNMVILMDEQFLVHTGVHKAVLRLLRSCVGDDLQEQMDNRSKRVMGAAGNAVRSSPSEYEEDLVNLLCILCSRIRTFRELLMIFFHDKNWGHSEPLFSVDEEDEDEEEEEEEDRTPTTEAPAGDQTFRVHSPAPSQSTAVSAPTSSVTRKSEYEFLLFNYLLRFVHREGKIGEFARAGLLFLMDVAMSPHDTGHRMAPEDGITSSASSETVTGDPIKEAALSLAEYILDGDFTEVLAAGLGAVYSLLPSKLDIKAPKSTTGAESGNMVLGSHFDVDEEPGEANTERARNLGISKEDSSNLDFKARLDHFLKLLEFLEDIFRRNTASPGTFDESTLVGSAIVESILDAVRRVFMENILYPSILECSDGDGSAVAVMSYIDVMIRTLEHGQLADVLVNFLMTEDNDDLPRSPLRVHGSAPPQSGKSTRAQKLNRRRSSAMVLLEMDAPDARRQSEYFTSMGRFTLKDLLLTNLRSKDEPTAATALQLLQSLLYQHNSLCVERLLLVARDPTATIFPQPLMINPYPPPDAPVSDDESEEFVYPGAQVDPEPRLQPPAPIFAQPGTTYATHEREMSLYLNLVSRIDPMHVSDAFSTGYDYYLRDAMASIQDHVSFIPDFTESALQSMKHRLNPNDPLLTLVLEWLRRFLSNKPESNMALTGVLAALAYDPNRSLAGWLTFGQTDQSTNLPSTVGVQSPEDDGDDRSIDCDIERRLASEAQSLPASSMNDQSRPVVFTILQGLVGQLERYRQTIDDFDKYLSERRQGLLFSENLTDALALTWDPDDPSAFAQVRPSTSITSQSQAPSPPQRAVPKKSNSFVSFLTPRKSKPPTPKATPTRSATNPGSPSKNTVTGPFGPHYQRTNSVIVEPFDAPLPNNGPWTPARSRKYVADDEDDVFSAGWNDDRTATSRQEEEKQVKTITLSQLLDNVVVLEESIKELVAIIHARKSLAVDSVRYV